MNYTKKPVTIQAWQFTKENYTKGVPHIFRSKNVSYWSQYGGKVIGGEIKTLEGVMEISENDWVICGVNGEFYPCKPDIFEKTYMPEIDVKEYIMRLRKLATSGHDKEEVYKIAGEILCDALKLFGQEKLIKEFKSIEDWYE
ncbi:TPA: hypothetical protein ACPJNL_000100 [Haemophilus influenzae]|uniref:hypothetical protein n=1 Tax=Haemophilus influenzae TaxID=727 RepID=UPI0034D9B9D5|nr:hypothetical protein [Haemophilus influenzae]MCK8910099.1 hypothetical protein [Haemophilus influenzae]